MNHETLNAHRYVNRDGVITGNLSVASASSYRPNIHTAAVRTKAGWVGQILVDDEIVWESTPTVAPAGLGADSAHPRSQAEALGVAERRIHARLAKVFD